jgi:hypothetical protein
LDEALNKGLAARGMKFLVGHGETSEGMQLDGMVEGSESQVEEEEFVFSIVGQGR